MDGVLEGLVCFAADSREWELRAGPATFLLPRCIFSLALLQWEAGGRHCLANATQANLRPCLEISSLQAIPGRRQSSAPTGPKRLLAKTQLLIWWNLYSSTVKPCTPF